MEWLQVLKDFVPLFQTAAWILLIAGVVIGFRGEWRSFVESLSHRDVKARGPFGLGLDVSGLPYVPPTGPATDRSGPAGTKVSEGKAEAGWIDERHRLEEQSRGIYLVHIIQPSTKPNQRFDLSVFLVEHRPERGGKRYDDIDYAEFFLGSHWQDRVFRVQSTGAVVGMTTSAYGPVLCLCRVVFKDQTRATLSRYLDFEMAGTFERRPAAAPEPRRP